MTSGPFTPTEDWIDAFDGQLNEPGFLESARRYARRRAALVAHTSVVVDEYYVSELVQDAVDDTIEGILGWDPGRATLRQHIFGAIRSRTRHHFVRAMRFPTHRYDPHDSEQMQLEDEATDVVARRSEIAFRVLAAIRSRAAGDLDVHRLLDAYVDGTTKKRDIVAITGLTTGRYEAARKRMLRIVQDLPSELVETAAACA